MAGTPLDRLMLSALGSWPSQRDNIGIYKMTSKYLCQNQFVKGSRVSLLKEIKIVII
jgi:hypothetical protein